jgi:hypothetical protein
VLRINFGAKNPAHRQYADRYQQAVDDRVTKKVQQQNEAPKSATLLKTGEVKVGFFDVLFFADL